MREGLDDALASVADLDEGDGRDLGGLAELRSLPVVRRVHPLFVFLYERGLTMRAAAEHLGVSEKTVRDWIGWRSRPPYFKARAIAGALGFRDDEELFPRRG